LFNKNSIFLIVSFSIVFTTLTACQSSTESVLLKFDSYFDGKSFNCSKTIESSGSHWRLFQAQFYVSNVAFKDQQNTWHKTSFAVSTGQSEQVALIGGICGNAFQWSTAVKSPISAKNISAIRFDLGVPESLNHKNPITQPSPLNQSDMFWTWRLGYKFARIEFASEDSEWIFHLGSTGCHSPSPVRPPKDACLNPNRVTVVFDNFRADQTISLNLDMLLNDIDMKANNNCQSSSDTPLCQSLFQRMGITKNSQQQVFELR